MKKIRLLKAGVFALLLSGALLFAGCDWFPGDSSPSPSPSPTRSPRAASVSDGPSAAQW
ncbi:MAG: hypothetical protein FWC64_00890 [Treponema sp.]|nr:hypothetical protein [Treponema sp.]